MNISDYRQLREAVRDYADGYGYYDDTTPTLDTLHAAARLTLDRWQECGECEGLGIDYCDGCVEEGLDGEGS